MVKKILVVIAVLAVVASLMLIGPMIGVNQKNKPFFTIGEYSSVVSSERPMGFLQAYAQTLDSEREANSQLVIYQQNMALVDEKRTVNFENGLNLLKFSDVPTQIDATSVLFRDLAFPETYVVEQVYDYDTADEESLLEKFLGKEITINATTGVESKEYSGKLLGYNDGITLETADGIVTIKNIEKINFPKAENLLTKPTLLLSVYTENAGSREINMSYISNGFNWTATYVAKLNDSDDKMDITGNVNIANNSGASFPNTKLTLLAGQVNRAYGSSYKSYDMMSESAPAPSSGGGGQFSEQSSFEYHTYVLERATDINDKETKLIQLLEAKNVPVAKEYVFSGSSNYYGSESTPESVDIRIAFKNDEASNLGMPMPAGVVRIYKEVNGGMQFVGEDSIDHTPKDIERKLYIGKAFDVTAEKTTTNTERTGNCNINSYKVKLKNQKTENVTVKVLENVYGDTTITEYNYNPEKKDAYTYEFSVPVNAGGEAELTYTVRSCY